MSNPAGQSVWDLTFSTPLIFIARNYKKTLLEEAESMRHELNSMAPKNDVLPTKSLNDSRNKR